MAEYLFVELTAPSSKHQQLVMADSTRRRLRTVVQRNSMSRRANQQSRTTLLDHPADRAQQDGSHGSDDSDTSQDNILSVDPLTDAAQSHEISGTIFTAGASQKPTNAGVYQIETTSSTSLRLRNSAFELGLIDLLIRNHWPYKNFVCAFVTRFFHQIPSTTHANDARRSCFLITVGSITHDPRMMMEARRRFTAALSALRDLVGRAQESMCGQFDGFSMLVAIFYILSFETITQETADVDFWRKHVDGMGTILRMAELPCPIPTQQRDVYLRIRHACFMVALWDRRALTIPTHKLEYSSNDTSGPGAMEMLVRLILPLPLLLEATDDLKSGVCPRKATIRVAQERLQSLRNDLEVWEKEFSTSPIARREICQERQCRGSLIHDDANTMIAPLSPAGNFVVSHEPGTCCVPCFLAAQTAAFCQMCNLLLLQAEIDLSNLPAAPPQDPSSHLQSRITATTDRLCNYVLHFDAVVEGTLRRYTAIDGLLLFLQRYFHDTADVDRLDWCHTINLRLRAQSGLSVREAAVPWTLVSILAMFGFD